MLIDVSGKSMLSLTYKMKFSRVFKYLIICDGGPEREIVDYEKPIVSYRKYDKRRYEDIK